MSDPAELISLPAPRLNPLTDTRDLPGRLIVLEGVDGSGKTTLRDRTVGAILDRVAVNAQSPKEIAQQPEFVKKSMSAISSLLWPREDTSFDHCISPYYWLYLQATWYTLLTDFVIRPKLAQGKVLLCDGWYYKFQAKLLLRGYPSDFLEEAFRPAIIPDLVVLLEPCIEEIWERKSFRLAEQGLHHSYEDLGRASFINYQSHVRRTLLSIASRRNWTTLEVRGRSTVDETAARLGALVGAWLTQQSEAKDRKTGESSCRRTVTP